MSSQSLPREMRQRLREYFMNTKHLRATKRDQSLMKMSAALRDGGSMEGQREVAHESDLPERGAAGVHGQACATLAAMRVCSR